MDEIGIILNAIDLKAEADRLENDNLELLDQLNVANRKLDAIAAEVRAYIAGRWSTVEALRYIQEIVGTS